MLFICVFLDNTICNTQEFLLFITWSAKILKLKHIEWSKQTTQYIEIKGKKVFTLVIHAQMSASVILWTQRV